MTIRVTHVVTGLETGGGETLLARLVARLDSADVSNRVISLTGRGPLADTIESAGAEVEVLGLSPRPGPAGIRSLRRAIRSGEPDLVQTWLLHANVLGGLVAGRVPVVWGVHQGAAGRREFGPVAAALQRVERVLSRRGPARIVACSASAEATMRKSGYDAAKVVLIENGFDTETFRPDPEDRERVRKELGVGTERLIVGHIARFHPVKDHATLLAAAGDVAERVPGALFVLAGDGVDDANPALAPAVARMGESVRLLGRRDDVPRLLRGLDLAVLSSAGEALPLVIGEAMATGVPFVSTDVGDAREVIGDTGRVVPARDPQALAGAIAELLELPVSERLALGKAARDRIDGARSLDAMAGAYLALWREVLDESAVQPRTA